MKATFSPTQIITKILLPLGYVKEKTWRKETQWTKETSECYLIIELQGGRFGQEAYLNIGTIVKSIEIRFPEHGYCYDNLHISTRASEAALKKCLHPDTPMTVAERTAALQDGLTNSVIPFLDALSSVSAIKEYYSRFTIYPPSLHTSPKKFGLPKPPRYRGHGPIPFKGHRTVLAGGLLAPLPEFGVRELDEETWRYGDVLQEFISEEDLCKWLEERDPESLRCFLEHRYNPILD